MVEAETLVVFVEVVVVVMILALNKGHQLVVHIHYAVVALINDVSQTFGHFLFALELDEYVLLLGWLEKVE